MDASMLDSLAFRSDRFVGHLTLDHGRANEMGSAQLSEWDTLCDRIEAGPLRAMITASSKISRRGTPIFIAGADVTERVGWTDEQVAAHVVRQRALMARIRRLPVFHVAVVSGVALGWGVEFLLACDYRIATPPASFALPETGIGILPGAGGTAELASAIGLAHALRLGMTGERISAEEALRIGLVQELAPDPDAAMARAEALAEQAARRSPTAIAAFKRGALASIGRPADRRTNIESSAYALCVAAGDAALGRARFKEITAGETVAWGPRLPFDPEAA